MSDELVGDNATLVWDGLSSVQLRYRGGWLKHKSAHTAQLLKALGERTVPVEALAGVELVLPGAAGDPMLRLELREGADPVMAVAGATIHRLFDPYRFYYGAKQDLLAEYYAHEIGTAIRLHQLDGPADRFLVAPPPAGDELKAFDAKLRLDGDGLELDWKWTAGPAKKAAGKSRTIPFGELTGVEWQPSSLAVLGHVRFHLAGDTSPPVDPKDDPRVVQLGAGDDAPGLLFAAALRARIDR
jgi:Domain of unknown function (DUF4429)